MLKSPQWQNLLFKFSTGGDCVFCAGKLLKYKTRQYNSGFLFFKEEVGEDESKYQSMVTVINVIECPILERCSQNDT